MAIVYQHRRLDTGQVFYIGIGEKEDRASSTKNRNNYWRNIVNAVGYKVEIILNDVSYDQAKKLEKYLINLYGRKDNKTGQLANMTDGGDGVVGLIVSDATRQLISEKTKEGMKNLDLTGSNNPMYGRLVTEETRAKLSLKSTGRPSVLKGKKNPIVSQNNSKKVIDTITGNVYNSAKDAASCFTINHYTLIGKLNGTSTNNTTLKYL